jgi:hypothetical protein
MPRLLFMEALRHRSSSPCTSTSYTHKRQSGNHPSGTTIGSPPPLTSTPPPPQNSFPSDRVKSVGHRPAHLLLAGRVIVDSRQRGTPNELGPHTKAVL